MSKLSGKVAVVTGASKGIGASIAKHLAAEGASIVVNYASDKRGAELVVAEIVKTGGIAIAVQASVAIETDVKSLFEQTEKAYGKVDILVNNAGVYAFAPIESVTAEEFSRQFTTNVFGLLLVTRPPSRSFLRQAEALSTSAPLSARWLLRRRPFTPEAKAPSAHGRSASMR
jgi:3-oxoacyl-[acyl-carrier protein] reductase